MFPWLGSTPGSGDPGSLVPSCNNRAITIRIVRPGAGERLRGLPSPGRLLRTLMLDVALGYSLR
jgi:hypothetical protein